MIDFRTIISPKSNAFLQDANEKMLRFGSMSPEAMARELLSMSRVLIDSDIFSKDQRWSYNEWALYRVIPELASRLDPNIVLRPEEQPDTSEKDDMVTWLRGEPDAKLMDCVSSIRGNASIHRAAVVRSKDPDLHKIAWLIDYPGHYSAVTIAMDTLQPGFCVDRAKPEHRPDLTGQYLIANVELKNDSRDDHEQVLQYSEDPHVIRTLLSNIEKYLADANDEKSDIDERCARRLSGISGRITELQIQSAAGEILERVPVQRASPSESHPEPSM